MKKTVLLTGGSGLLAINWALAISNDFDVVLGLHKKYISIIGIQSVFINIDTIQAFSADLQKIRPDVVIHCAGLANVEICEADPAAAYHINVALSVNVASACKMADVSFVYIATDHIFEGKHPLVTEVEMPVPINEYGKTKFEGEKRILEISNRNISIRTNFYGWGSSYRSSFSDMIIQNVRRKRAVSLFDDFFYTPILIQELAQITMLLYTKEASGIFNVAGNERISKYEFGIRLADHFGLDKNLIKVAKFSERKDLVKRPRDLSLSVKKAVAFLDQSIGSIELNLAQLQLQEQDGLSALISKL